MRRVVSTYTLAPAARMLSPPAIILDTFNTGNFSRTPSLDGVFMNIGGGIMLSPRFGFGAEVRSNRGRAITRGWAIGPCSTISTDHAPDSQCQTRGPGT